MADGIQLPNGYKLVAADSILRMPRGYMLVDSVPGAAPAAKPAAQPDAEPAAQQEAPAPSLWDKAVTAVKGKQDPAYGNLPVYSGHDVAQTGGGAAMLAAGGTDDDFADLIKKQLGDRHVRTFKDANGYPIIEYKGQDGKPRQEYVNRPGLDLADVFRGVAGSLPYLPASAAAGGVLKGAGIIANTVGQAATAGATNVGAQVARQAAGGEQSLDPTEAGLVAGGAGVAQAVAPAIGAVWRKLVTEPSLFDKATGQLTQKGLQVAKEAGIDPGTITPDFAKQFAKTYAMSGDAAKAAADTQLKSNGIPISRGQLAKDPEQLLAEKGMRYGLYGDSAKGVMRDFDAQQAEAIQNAALGGAPPKAAVKGVPLTDVKQGGVAGRIAPDVVPPSTPGGTIEPARLGRNVQEGVSAAKAGAGAAEDAAWAKVGPLNPTKGALDLLPEHINAKLTAGNIVIDDNTPVAKAMAQRLGQYVRGEAPTQVDAILSNSPVKDVDRLRRMMGRMTGSAQGEDKHAAGAVYDAVNDWIESSAAAKLLEGDPASAAAMVNARSVTREIKELFEPKAGGVLTPGGQRLKTIMQKADTPEGIIDGLLGSPGGRSVPQGSAQALANLKQAVDRFAPDQAAQTWQSLKLAYWTRLVQAKTGDMYGPQAIVSNLKTAMTGQQSIYNQLFTGAERGRINSFLSAMQQVAWKDPNPSGSGTAAASYAKQALGAIWDALGMNSKWAQAAIERTGVMSAYGTGAAKEAVRAAVPTATPQIAPYGAMLGEQMR